VEETRWEKVTKSVSALGGVYLLVEEIRWE